MAIGNVIFVRNRNSLTKNEQSMRLLAYWKLTSKIHSSRDLNRPEAKRFRVKRTNLGIPKIDFVEVSIDPLEAENLKSKNFADEYPSSRVLGESPSNRKLCHFPSFQIHCPSRC